MRVSLITIKRHPLCTCIYGMYMYMYIRYVHVYAQKDYFAGKSLLKNIYGNVNFAQLIK